MLELYKQCELMAKKKYSDGYGTATATALRQATVYHSTGRGIVADSLLKSLKITIKQTKYDLYCNITNC